ncbi:MAG: 30S ribosomal protein S17 [Latescibacteria bacterium DG_63]|nr:MAG: 30S ribosomal protein S17 [Latescibacteria bacterium DG_63]
MEGRGKRKVRIGRVVSRSGDKSVVIEIRRLMKHPIYGKYVRRRTKLHVHDAGNQCQIGDLVRVSETRPLSKLKRWRFVEVLEKAR